MNLGRHPRFVYESFTVEQTDLHVQISFRFLLEPDQVFHPWLRIAKPAGQRFPESLLQNLAFHLGLIELISYWKAACPPEILVRAGSLAPEQVEWWKQVYFHGLGEFFYTNGLNPNLENFVRIQTQGPVFLTEILDLRPANLIPVGGGKDSLVTLDLLKAHRTSNRLFFLNPTKAQWDSAAVMGYAQDQVVVAERKIDPGLLELNRQGYLNGHTPFSALLGFAAVTAAALHGLGQVVLSNEGSADESTVPGTTINHQWSKSGIYEKMFHDYVRQWLIPSMNYSSLLRSWNELQIARHFTTVCDRSVLRAFRSCNVGQKTDTWCCTCPKCLFVNTMLAPFLTREAVREIFGGREPLDDPGLDPIFQQLIGAAPTKPFECVGGVEEVRAALSIISRQPSPPKLVWQFVESFASWVFSPERAEEISHGQIRGTLGK